MADLRAATRAVSEALSTGQIGDPVALRIVAHGTADHGLVTLTTAEALSAAATWFNQEPQLLHVAGSASTGQVSSLSRFSAGQSALVSAGTRGLGRPLLAIEIWGNRGMLSWIDDTFNGSISADNSPSAQTKALLRKIQEWPREDAAAGRSRNAPSSSSPPVATHKPPYGVLLVSGDYTHQPAYAAALAADSRCRVIGLTDEPDVTARRRALNAQLAERLNVPVLPDLRAALAREDVDIVSLCAEPDRRGRIAILAAKAGKHLYLDKPLAGSLQDAQAVAAAIAQAGVVSHMFSMVHGDPARRVQAMVDANELGPLTAVHLDLTFAKGTAATAALGSMRKENPAPDLVELPDSKRELTNVGVYSIVQLLTLFNRPVRSVTGTTGNYFFRENQQNDMEDFGQILLEFEGGLVATISTGRTGWHSHPAGGLNRAFLLGERGGALVDAYNPRVEVWSDAAPWAPPERNPDDPMGMWVTPPGSAYQIAPKRTWLTSAADLAAADVGHFLDCLEHGRPPAVSANVALAATEILNAAYQSAATGRKIDLPSPL